MIGHGGRNPVTYRTLSLAMVRIVRCALFAIMSVDIKPDMLKSVTHNWSRTMLKARINLLHPVVARELAVCFAHDAQELTGHAKSVATRRANKLLMIGNMAAIALALELSEAQRVYVNPNH